MINEGKGNPIEIDAASNNGVEQVRTIIDDAKFKPIDSKYKVYILDEVHMLSLRGLECNVKIIRRTSKDYYIYFMYYRPTKNTKDYFEQDAAI